MTNPQFCQAEGMLFGVAAASTTARRKTQAGVGAPLSKGGKQAV